MKRRVLSRPGVNSLMSFHERLVLTWRKSTDRLAIKRLLPSLLTAGSLFLSGGCLEELCFYRLFVQILTGMHHWETDLWLPNYFSKLFEQEIGCENKDDITDTAIIWIILIFLVSHDFQLPLSLLVTALQRISLNTRSWGIMLGQEEKGMKR